MQSEHSFSGPAPLLSPIILMEATSISIPKRTMVRNGSVTVKPSIVIISFGMIGTRNFRVAKTVMTEAAPKNKVATNQRDGQMAYHQDLVPGVNPHINYEPSSLGGLKEATKSGKEHEPAYNTRLVRQKIERTNDFKQAGETYRNFEDWEREDLINNLVNTLANADKVIQDKMIENFTKADADYGRRVADGLKNAKKNIGDVGAPAGATKTEEGVQQAEQVSREAKPY